MLSGFLAALFIFQLFLTNQNFNTKPIYGSVLPSSQPLTEQDITSTLNLFVIYTVFFNQLPSSSLFHLLTLQSLNVSSTYNGTVISNDNGFDFGPTVIKDDDAYKMWWCGTPPANSTYVFGIYYATSNDSLQWSPRQLVLQPTSNSSDSLFVCQPTVVKVNSTYYMYYAGASLNITNVSITAQCSIFLATSNDGIHWTKYGSNSNPQPVINPVSDTLAFVNQPSVLYYNKFYLYYTNSSSGNGTDTFLATADDGMHFTVQNKASPVFSPPVGDDRDVKILNPFGTFFMVYGSIDTNKIFWTNSSDGINWQAHDSSRTIQTKKFCNFGPALLSYANGTSDSQSIVYYSAGDTLNSSTIWGCVNPESWRIDASLINVTSVNISQSFNSSGFKCSSVNEGFYCRFNYTNTLNESAVVVFIFVDSYGNVISNSIPLASQGISQIGALLQCTQFSGKATVSWKVYRQSDLLLANPITWSKDSERQTIVCAV
jgi:predicted GH43/DUF377 family glycosyl hydrolase